MEKWSAHGGDELCEKWDFDQQDLVIVLGGFFSKEIKENNENYADEESERDKTTVASTIKLELIHWSKLANSYKTRTIRFFVPN